MKPKNVSVSAIEVDGQIKVWGCSFTLPATTGYLPHHENHKILLRRIEKAVAAAIAEIEIEN